MNFFVVGKATQITNRFQSRSNFQRTTYSFLRSTCWGVRDLCDHWGLYLVVAIVNPPSWIWLFQLLIRNRRLNKSRNIKLYQEIPSGSKFGSERVEYLHGKKNMYDRIQLFAVRNIFHWKERYMSNIFLRIYFILTIRKKILYNGSGSKFWTTKCRTTKISKFHSCEYWNNETWVFR